MKLELKNVTLCAVTSIELEETIKALKYCMNGINFGDVKLISDQEVKIDGIKWEPCKNIDYAGYSIYIVNDLHKHIDTEYALVINYDGFVVNPEMWRDEFLDYDYIGAPWPMIPSRPDWVGNGRVGNGGFSLRSKKILEAASKYNFSNRFQEYSYYNEDGYFCTTHKHVFMEVGCKFAPLDLAIYFSHELDCPEIEGIKPFGFHGKHHTQYLELLNTI